MIALLLALATPEATLATLAEADLKVAMIGYRLVTANAARCPRTVPATGLLLHTAEQYDGDFRPAARRLFALGDGVEIAAVVPGSPAARAGLAPSQTIAAIGGVRLPPPAKGFARTAQALDRLDSGAPLTVDGRPVTLAPVRACASRFQIRVSRSMNAAADGRTVEVTTGFMAKFADDDELAAILAHELAHNILDHPAKLNAQGVSRGLFGKLGKDARRVRQTEIEADRLSVHLLTAAGFRPQAAVAFWRRFGKAHDAGIFSDATHLRWKPRVALLEAEIAALQRGE